MTKTEFKRISQWGNSFAIPFSTELLKEAGLKKKDWVKITASKNRLVIQKADGDKK